MLRLFLTHLCEDPDAGDVSLYQNLSNQFQLSSARKDHLIDVVEGRRFDSQPI